MSDLFLQDPTFSTERINRIMFWSKQKGYKEDREKLIPQTSLTVNEGLNLIREYGFMLKKCIRGKSCEAIIEDVARYLGGRWTSADTHIQNICLFDDFLAIYLTRDEKEEFCRQIELASIGIIGEADKKHLLFQLGHEFGYQA